MRLGWLFLRSWLGMSLVAALALLDGCAPSHYVRPLAEGEMAISGSFGGPLIQNFGPPIPIPYSTIGFGYGWKPQTTVFGDFHATSAAFGVIQVDGGLSHSFLAPKGARPGISVSPVLNFAVDIWEGNARLWPQLDANAYWEYGAKKNFLYAGTSLWVELAGTKAHGESQSQRLFPNVQVGHVLMGKKLDFVVEWKYLNPVQSPEYVTTVQYMPLGNRGANGIYVGFIRRFK